jgi:hypothetical protein
MPLLLVAVVPVKAVVGVQPKVHQGRTEPMRAEQALHPVEMAAPTPVATEIVAEQVTTLSPVLMDNQVR